MTKAQEVSTTITPKAFAEEVNSNPKLVRRWLRSMNEGSNPGKGGRWALNTSDLPELIDAFNTWVADRNTVTFTLPDADAED